MSKYQLTRRDFMGQACCAAVSSTALANTLLNLVMTGAASAESARDAQDYKAIVCLFLPGGNDSFNLLVPRGQTEYGEYQAVRQDLALSQGDLLALNPLNNPGQSLGLHPGVPELHQLFNQGKMAMLANVGSLTRPTTKQMVQQGVGLPYGLYSHSDQQEQWQTSIPDTRAGHGWAGRIADLLIESNDPSPVSMNISIAGNNLLMLGQSVVPYTVNSSGALALQGYKDGSPFSSIRTQAVDSLLAEEYNNVLDSTFATKTKRALEAFDAYSSATAVPLPSGVTFPNTGLGNQLRQVARTIAGRDVLGVKRQIFYIAWGGWDFHDNVLNNMSTMLPVVSQAVKAFYDATVAMGLAENVTLFTASDFGRTLTSNAQGSDHGWGGNQFVVGGAVKGQRIFGQYPSLVLGGADDAGRGNMIPTTSVDQYAAELALWMGVSPSTLSYVLPNITRFYNPTSGSAPLGFLV